MSIVDLILLVMFALGLPLGLFANKFSKKRQVDPQVMARIYGVGAVLYAFVGLMSASIFLRPRAELLEYTATNCLLSGAIGFGFYLSLAAAAAWRRKR